MSRYEETKSALTQVLEGLGAEPTSLYDVGVPMVGKGFSQDEILNGLMALDREKIIVLLPGNQVRVLLAQP